MGKDSAKLRDLLTIDATGYAQVVSKVTGEEKTESVQVPLSVPDLTGVDPALLGVVSVELESSRNMRYNKVSVKVFARANCLIGTEQSQAARLLQGLDQIVQDYANVTAGELLSRWKDSE